MAPLRFYDDVVRDALEELGDVDFQRRLWLGLGPGRMSSPTECYEVLFGDSGLDRALDAGEAYGEPIDEMLRRIDSLMHELNLELPLRELEANEEFLESRRLAADVSNLLKDRPSGTVSGEPLDPL